MLKFLILASFLLLALARVETLVVPIQNVLQDTSVYEDDVKPYPGGTTFAPCLKNSTGIFEISKIAIVPYPVVKSSPSVLLMWGTLKEELDTHPHVEDALLGDDGSGRVGLWRLCDIMRCWNEKTSLICPPASGRTELGLPLYEGSWSQKKSGDLAVRASTDTQELFCIRGHLDFVNQPKWD